LTPRMLQMAKCQLPDPVLPPADRYDLYPGHRTVPLPSTRALRTFAPPSPSSTSLPHPRAPAIAARPSQAITSRCLSLARASFAVRTLRRMRAPPTSHVRSNERDSRSSPVRRDASIRLTPSTRRMPSRGTTTTSRYSTARPYAPSRRPRPLGVMAVRAVRAPSPARSACEPPMWDWISDRATRVDCLLTSFALSRHL
jgi:hypothetical protein